MSIDVAQIAAVLALGFAAYVVFLVRQGWLRESYALIWLGIGSGMVLFALQRTWLDAVGRYLGVVYPPAFFLLLGLLFSLVIGLNLTVHLSRQNDRTVRLAQEVALLRRQLEELEQNGLPDAGR